MMAILHETKFEAPYSKKTGDGLISKMYMDEFGGGWGDGENNTIPNNQKGNGSFLSEEHFILENGGGIGYGDDIYWGKS